MKITSVNNELIKETAKLLQRKYRDENEMFLLEGEKCITEAILSGIKIKHLFVTPDSPNIDFPEKIETTENVIAKISSTTTPPKMVASAYQPIRNWSNDYKKIVLLENIKDAGNLGTIIRTSCAFDVDAIILYGDTVDLYNPKCVRSSVGNLWKIPVFNMTEDEIKIRFNDFQRIATLPKCNNTIWLKDFCPKDKILLMFGEESSGLSNNLKNFATENLSIEMSKKVESLNLAISVSVILYTIF